MRYEPQAKEKKQAKTEADKKRKTNGVVFEQKSDKDEPYSK
jgi:hypothetical protein